MKIFNKYIYIFNKKKKKINFNFFVPSRNERNFANADIVSCMMMIINRLQHVEFHAKIEFIEVNKMFDFLKENALQILQRLFYDGYFILDVDAMMFRKIEFQSTDLINSEIEIVLNENEICYFDTKYLSSGQTDRRILSSYVDFLNIVNNSDCNLIENYGAMGILTPENSAISEGYMDEEDKKGLQEEYNNLHGLSFGKWSIMIAKQPLKFQPIALPIKELELAEKRKNALAEILQFFNIPKELHALFENSKYANRNEAELDIYTNAVSAFATTLVNIAKKVYEVKRMQYDYYTENEFWFDIVGVPALADSSYTDKQRAREELKFWQEAKGSMPEKRDYIDKRISDLIDTL